MLSDQNQVNKEAFKCALHLERWCAMPPGLACFGTITIGRLVGVFTAPVVLPVHLTAWATARWGGISGLFAARDDRRFETSPSLVRLDETAPASVSALRRLPCVRARAVPRCGPDHMLLRPDRNETIPPSDRAGHHLRPGPLRTVGAVSCPWLLTLTPEMSKTEPRSTAGPLDSLLKNSTSHRERSGMCRA